jgi:predicted transcriptional regulator
VEDTWAVRDVPVLSAVVELLDHSYMVTVSDVAEKTGLDLAEVSRSLEAMDPTFVDFRKTETGGDPRFWYVNRVTPEARQAIGQWPTAESLVDRLVKAFGDAADHEEDAERHYQLRQAAGLLGETVRDVAVRVAATITGPLASSPAAAGNGPGPSDLDDPPSGASPERTSAPGEGAG